MPKYKDVKSLGQSKIAPFKKNESYRARHARRKSTNLSYRDELSEWCSDNDWTFEIKNDEHHWIFWKGNILFEWWPSTAKLVKNKNWAKGMHCHDYKKVIRQLQKV